MTKLSKDGKKLYPFSIEKNAHNWDLVRNYSFNRIRDMESGETPMDKKLYDKLTNWFERADALLDNWGFCGPVAWMPGKVYGEAREVSDIGVEIRMGACIDAGREDLLQYC